MAMYLTLNPVLFHSDDFGAVPADAIKLEDEQYPEILAAHYAGKVLAIVDGQVVVTDPPAEAIDAVRSRLSAAIDDLAADVLSKWTRFQVAYQAREAAAQAFKDAGYQGDPGIWITGFATPAGLSLQSATDRILAQATTLNAALPALDSLRMRKYELALANDAAHAQATYDDIAGKINALAAGLQ